MGLRRSSADRSYRGGSARLRHLSPAGPGGSPGPARAGKGVRKGCSLGRDDDKPCFFPRLPHADRKKRAGGGDVVVRGGGVGRGNPGKLRRFPLFGRAYILESHRSPLGCRPEGDLPPSSTARVSDPMSESISSPTPLVVIPWDLCVRDDYEPPSPAPRPVTGHRHAAWADVPDSDWLDWRWQAQHAVRHARQLAGLLSFTDEERRALSELEAQYKLAIPPYYFSLIDPEDPNDPIRLQSVPSPLELLGAAGTEEDDPLDEDKDSPVPGLTHRYPDRALLVTTHVCTMYCRFCTRKRATMKRGGWDSVSRDDRRMVEYVAAQPTRRWPRRHRLGRRPAHAPAGEARLLRRELDGPAARRRHPDRHPGPRHAPPAARRRRTGGAAGRVGQDLDPDPLQPPPRGHARGHPRLRPAPAPGDADQQPRGVAQGCERLAGDSTPPSAGRCCGSRSGRTTCSTATP